VRKRMREFGVRVALGASPRDMMKLTLGRGALQLAASLAAGGAIGFLASRPMLKSLEGMTAKVPPSAYIVILAVVAVSTFAALWLPAREATKVDPAETLRAE
jgi:putative ABC transport system permease protein